MCRRLPVARRRPAPPEVYSSRSGRGARSELVGGDPGRGG